MKKLIRALFICTVALILGVGVFQVNVAKAEPPICEDVCLGGSPYTECVCIGSKIFITCQTFWAGWCI